MRVYQILRGNSSHELALVVNRWIEEHHNVEFVGAPFLTHAGGTWCQALTYTMEEGTDFPVR